MEAELRRLAEVITDRFEILAWRTESESPDIHISTNPPAGDPGNTALGGLLLVHGFWNNQMPKSKGWIYEAVRGGKVRELAVLKPAPDNEGLKDPNLLLKQIEELTQFFQTFVEGCASPVTGTATHSDAMM